MKFEFVHEKGTGNINEDIYLAEKNIFGVFDGATSLDGARYEKGLTGGYMASAIAAGAFAQNNTTLTDLAYKANCQIRECMEMNGVDLAVKEKLWSTGAAVIRINPQSLSWIQTGDCIIIIIFQDKTWKLPFKGFNHDYETLKMFKSRGYSTENSDPCYYNQIKNVRRKMNIEYGVLNGEDSFKNFLNHGEENLDNISEILIFTDGLFLPSEKPQREFCFDEFMKIYFKKGLSGLKGHVRMIEDRDPECIKYPRFKHHDDIAAISVKLSY